MAKPKYPTLVAAAEPPQQRQHPHGGGHACAPALPLVVESDDYSWTTTGTRDQLIAAGVCTAAQFPAGRKRTADNFAACRTNPELRGWLLRAVGGGRWCLLQDRSRSERTARIELQRRLAEAEARRADRFTDPEAWRQRRLGALDSLHASFSNGARFRLGQRDQQAFDALARRMEMVLVNAEVVADQAAEAALAAEVQALRATIAADRPPAASRPRLRLVDVQDGGGATSSTTRAVHHG